MAKVPLADQIAAVKTAAERYPHTGGALEAALATLELFQRFETPVKACLANCLDDMRALQDQAAQAVLAEFPGAEVTVRTLE